MKKTLLAGTTALMTLFNASAADCGCSEATVCDEEKLDLTGVWLGAGVIVDFDKYDADVAVAAEYADLQDKYRTSVITQGTSADPLGDAVLAAMVTHLQTPEDVDRDAAALGYTAGGDLVLKQTSANQDTTLSNPHVFYAHRTLKMKKTKTVAGGELKGSLFYNVDNGLVFGIDLSLGLTAKAKKTIDINGSFASKTNARDASVADSKVYSVIAANSGNIPLYTTGETVITSAMASNAAPFVTNNVLVNYSYARTGVVAANAGASVSDDAGHSFVYNRDAAGANQTINDNVDGKLASAEFEKDIFSPTLAFVVGGYFKGFFGGLRFGMNYMTGKIHNLKSIDGAVAEDVKHKIRQASPILGIQIMKHIKKGLFAYLVYDHAFGINKTYLNSPINKFKRRQNRISLGLGYQFKANH